VPAASNLGKLKHTLSLMVALKLAVAALGVFLYAQAQQTEAGAPRFATASVKADTSDHNGIGNKFDPVMIRWTSTPLRVLVQAAYGLKSYQMEGWPNSLNSDKWNIDARTDGPTTSKQKYEMLQTLIVERFGLKFHREMKDIPGYVLVIAKNGPKLREVKEGEGSSIPAGATIQSGLIIGHQVRMMDWVGLFASVLGCPFEDSTGLMGKYDFKLEWAPDDTQPNGGEAPDTSRPTIFAALQEQLGLKLEVKKFPVEMFVIDHVDKVPAVN
jgi:uncharacterized protein (TIGR03435 family)